MEITNRIEGSTARAFVVTYRYTDPELRALHRNEHLERLRRLAEDGRVVLGGPQPDAIGGVLLLLAETREAAQAIIDADAYIRGGVAADLEVVEFVPIVSGRGLLERFSAAGPTPSS
jgi:uncharacterized protein YciI